MSDVTQRTARLRQLRNAALVAVLIPAALIAGCAQPAPPPPPQPMAAPMPPPPPGPVPVPYVRG